MRIGQSLGRTDARRQGAFAPHSQRGFTLLEMLVVIVIIGIVAAIATPQFSKWRNKQAVNTAAKALLAHMKQARATSMAENRNVSITFTSTGYTYDADTTGNGTCGLCKPQTVSFSNISSQLSVSPTTTRTFTSAGMVNFGSVTLTAGSASQIIDLNLIGRAYLQ